MDTRNATLASEVLDTAGHELSDGGGHRSPAPTVVSLFGGCGGMDLGFEQAGFEVAAANDVWTPAVNTHRANFPATAMVAGNITDPDIKARIIDACGGSCDVVIGGPPCQAYSKSGKRDPNDPRGRLFEEYLAVVAMLSPFVIVMENVDGILSPREGEEKPVIARIVSGLGDLQFHAEFQPLNSGDYGAPQCRKRVIIIAARPGIRIRFPEPTHAEKPSPSNRLLPWVTIRDAIDDLKDLPEDRASFHIFTKNGPIVAERFSKTPIGGKGVVSYNEGFFRNPPDKPSVTIKTGMWPIHYARPRELSCREAARIQSFPDSFRFVGGKSAVSTMIGNAVPPLLARAVAGSVREMLDEARAGKIQQSAPVEITSDKSAVEADMPEAILPVQPVPRLLCNGSSKKGPLTWAFSITMPNGRCPFASSICSRWCYADVGHFPQHQSLYERNYEASKEAGFADRLRDEVTALAWRHSGQRASICAHEKGEFHSVGYLRAWGQVIRDTRSFPNLSYYVYTRSWVSPPFRGELDRIAADCRNVRINLSLDREMVERHGVPARVGDGLLVYLCETDRDLPPAGVDIALRNLRVLNHAPMERIGGALVCPNESGLCVAKDDGAPVIKVGKTIRVRCQDCRICIDRGIDRWEQVKARYTGTPGSPNAGSAVA